MNPRILGRAVKLLCDNQVKNSLDFPSAAIVRTAAPPSFSSIPSASHGNSLGILALAELRCCFKWF